MAKGGHGKRWQDSVTDLSLSEDSLLSIALRSRAASVAELAALAVRGEDEVRHDLKTLEEQGYLRVKGRGISYQAPENAVVEQVRERTARLGDDLTRGLAELASVVERLPRLLRDDVVGEAGSELMDIEVFHGPEAVVDLWHRKQARDPSRHTDIVLPAADRLAEADPAMQQVWHEALQGEGRGARVLGAVSDVVSPQLQARLAQELAGGVEIRMMHEPPSWFWVADGTTLAVPMVWGEAWPTSVVSIQSPALAGLAGWLFERLWERAVPAGGHNASWDALLGLMRGGSTLEQASQALGISDRTGRRRISDAMDHFGARSIFSLGVLWGQRQG